MNETQTGLYEVQLETNKCRAYGLCVGLAPDTFELPSGSPKVAVTRPVVSEEDYDDVDEAVEACPAQALRLVKRGDGQ